MVQRINRAELVRRIEAVRAEIKAHDQHEAAQQVERELRQTPRRGSFSEHGAEFPETSGCRVRS